MQYKISEFNNRQVLPELRSKGIYKIETPNGHIYIGSAGKNFRHRWFNHAYYLKNNKHHSQYLQNIYNKYGIDHLNFSVIEELVGDKNLLIEREQYWIDLLEPDLNMIKTAYSSLGRRHTEETREKMRESKRKLTKESNGIHYLKKSGKFRVVIDICSKKIVVGNYENYNEALEQRKEAVDYFWSEEFNCKTKEDQNSIVQQYKKERDSTLNKGTNIGLNYIRKNKNCNTFRFDYYPKKHIKYFKTVEEAVKYKEEYFASGCTLQNIKKEPKCPHKYIRQNKSGGYDFRYSKTKYSKTFKTLEETIEHRDKYLLDLALNPNK